MDTTFNEDYYERGVELGISGYSNYRWIPELTIPMCHEISTLLNIKDNDIILDYGCAKGYTVKGFRLLHKNAYGVDISDYAISQAPEDVKKYLYKLDDNNIPLINNKKYNFIIAKDVLEHIPYEYIDDILTKIRSSTDKFFVVVPLGKNGKFIIPSYELDKTHIIREDMNWWENKFKQNKFLIKSKKYKIKHLKENWAHWKKGNGFFVLK